MEFCLLTAPAWIAFRTSERNRASLCPWWLAVSETSRHHLARIQGHFLPFPWICSSVFRRLPHSSCLQPNKTPEDYLCPPQNRGFHTPKTTLSSECRSSGADTGTSPLRLGLSAGRSPVLRGLLRRLLRARKGRAARGPVEREQGCAGRPLRFGGVLAWRQQETWGR